MCVAQPWHVVTLRDGRLLPAVVWQWSSCVVDREEDTAAALWSVSVRQTGLHLSHVYWVTHHVLLPLIPTTHSHHRVLRVLLMNCNMITASRSGNPEHWSLCRHWSSACPPWVSCPWRAGCLTCPVLCGTPPCTTWPSQVGCHRSAHWYVQ